MQKMPPIAAISAKGPLGLVHLPRMWSKALLGATGHLAPGYRTGCYFDRTLMGSLGISTEAALAYIGSELPTYARFEQWVLEQAGGHIAPESIVHVNRAILSHEFDGEELRSFQSELGLPEDSPIRKTADLEQLDDWVQFHTLLSGADA